MGSSRRLTGNVVLWSARSIASCSRMWSGQKRKLCCWITNPAWLVRVLVFGTGLCPAAGEDGAERCRMGGIQPRAVSPVKTLRGSDPIPSSPPRRMKSRAL